MEVIIIIGNLFSVVVFSEGVQCKSRDLEDPPAVHVTVSTRQVTV